MLLYFDRSQSDQPMIYRNASTLLLALLLLVACTRKQATETSKPETPPQAAVADPTPPGPPNSVEVPADLKNMPTFVTLAIGGIGSEGEKEGIEVQENPRLFRTEAQAQEIISFYAKELKDRGWTTHNQVARSGTVGLSMQEYRRAGTDALYVIVSEPEDPQSSDPKETKRHVVLLSAKVRKPKP